MAGTGSSSYGRGAALLSVGIGVTGLVTYAYFALASHALTSDQYGSITLLWSTVFIVVTVLYRPVEQLLARTIAEQSAALGGYGSTARRTLRIAATIQLALGALFLVAALLLRDTIERDLFSGSSDLYWIMVATVLAYAVSYFARGVLAGHKRFGFYGGLVLIEATSRVAFAVVVAAGLASGEITVALGILAAPIVSLVVVPWAARKGATRSSSVADSDRDQPPGDAALDAEQAFDAASAGSPTEDVEFTLARGSGFAVAAITIMLCEQTFLNAGPLIIKATADADGAVTSAALAGLVFNILLIARAPLQLFQSVSTSLLPHLAGLRAATDEDTDSATAYRRSINLTLIAVAGFAAIVALIMLAVGPVIMRLAFGDKFEYGRGGLVLVAAGMGFYLAAATLNQAALAARRTGVATAVWLISAVAFVSWLLAPVIDDRILRVETGFLGAAVILCSGLGLLSTKDRQIKS